MVRFVEPIFYRLRVQIFIFNERLFTRHSIIQNGVSGLSIH